MNKWEEQEERQRTADEYYELTAGQAHRLRRDGRVIIDKHDRRPEDIDDDDRADTSRRLSH